MPALLRLIWAHLEPSGDAGAGTEHRVERCCLHLTVVGPFPGPQSLVLNKLMVHSGSPLSPEMSSANHVCFPFLVIDSAAGMGCNSDHGDGRKVSGGFWERFYFLV